VEAAIAKLQQAKAAPAAGQEQSAEAEEEQADSMDVEAMPEISIEDFAKLQIQVGEIVSCEAVKKSKKLLCSQVKIGSETRQILSGIKQWYTPEEMVGKKVLVITNLKPAKLAGLESQGMILCAEDDQGRLSLVRPEGEVSCGAEVR
jgi:methionyl-tRNA synthetase